MLDRQRLLEVAQRYFVAAQAGVSHADTAERRGFSVTVFDFTAMGNACSK
jgi:hypothetical protein